MRILSSSIFEKSDSISSIMSTHLGGKLFSEIELEFSKGLSMSEFPYSKDILVN
jgi:hypothetical protein